MTTRERFQAVLNGEKPDRMPVWEWAHWWKETLQVWIPQGLPAHLDQQGIFTYLGLDMHYQNWLSSLAPDCPKPPAYGQGIVETEADYEKILPFLYPERNLDRLAEWLLELKPRHDRGDIMIWFSLDGFFWYPRRLMGIENHLYAFYDQPELMHRMNQDQADSCRRAVERIMNILVPEFMTFGEDLSYNHGPMLSEEQFDTFLVPYYRQVVPAIRQAGTRVLVDSDGFVEPMIPWFQKVGIEGILPLERQAGVDVARIREKYPDWIMVGGFDKTIMHLGEEAMRAEFERLLPVMRSGRYILGVDHQTPPDVSLEMYRRYIRLFREYAQKAAE